MSAQGVLAAQIKEAFPPLSLANFEASGGSSSSGRHQKRHSTGGRPLAGRRGGARSGRPQLSQPTTSLSQKQQQQHQSQPQEACTPVAVVSTVEQPLRDGPELGVTLDGPQVPKSTPDIDMAVQAMSMNPESVLAQEWGSKTLLDISQRPGHLQQMRAGAVVSVLVKAMRSHLSAYGVQLSAACALERLCSGNAESVKDLLDSDGLTVIVKAMQSFGDQQGLQEAGCKLLRNAAACSSEGQEKVAAAGGIPATLHAMSKHQSSSALQELGCRALREMAAYCAANQEEIVAHGGIPRVLNAMETHIKLSSIQVLGCGVLRNLTACNADFQEAVSSRGGLQVVIDAMECHAESADVQRAGCWALFCSCVHNSELQKVVEAHGGVKACLKALQDHRDDARVQEAGCWVIKELAQTIVNNQSSRTTFVSSTQVVLKAMDKHRSVAAVQTAAGGALRGLASHDTSGWVKTACLGRCGRFQQSTTKRVLEVIQE